MNLATQKLIKLNIQRSPKLISTAARSYATKSPAKIEEKGKASEETEVDPNSLHLIKAKAWLDGEGAKYKDVLPGQTNYVGTTRPFPLNPFFRPQTPVSDKIKNEIYELYLKDPVANTPRILGMKFRLSIKRIQGILTLKAMEMQHSEVEGKILQKNFTKGMESIMGVNPNETTTSISSRGFSEPLSYPNTNVGEPFFKIVPETEEYTSSDAADALGREPYKKVFYELNKSEFFEINNPPNIDPKYAPRNPKNKHKYTNQVLINIPDSSSLKTISSDPSIINRRWDFVFTDTSNSASKTRALFVRTKEGTLYSNKAQSAASSKPKSKPSTTSTKASN
ncbi:37S ribosomal protein S35, mitochondrial [Zancudomyces culisetae]|uniref:37S ribosomal protein S35, mitochondrial n=1 Tax=Zancudomyces culisetae TaxID=1213189 RepID=A0A1R1PDX0_ZANCU|nr:37S ribosomal protein S35, mitochondrial [Zancudomyces culisetae]OMH79177.1 37S ribosomal protein S35, mitochondrial [Zancudomyces culisetae]|eukprot:OMH78808.1 37S ribosomal protein S35, mitochondrial [Zancudomyces culisetae]